MTDLKPGDFGCTSNNSYVGKLISIGEWLNGNAFVQYVHAEIYIGQADLKAPLGYTFSAYPGGARLRPLSELEFRTGLWSSGVIKLTDAQRQNIVDNALSLKGTPYSAEDYFALAAHRLRLPVPFLKDYVASSKHMICSQLVDFVYMQSGIHLFNDGRWPGYVTPADLASLLGK